MDWCSWISRTNLDSSLVHEYSLAFTRNELQLDDAVHFNHEFLQSMGISVAKHRLEILKLAQKETRGSRRSLLKLACVINKTRKTLAKSVSKWTFHKSPARMALSDLTPQWTGALRKQNGSNGFKEENVMIHKKNTMRSGPLDRREQEKLMITSRYMSVSGPLDEKMEERMMLRNLSPIVIGRVKEKVDLSYISPREYGPLDGLGLSPKLDGEDRVPSLWSLMFEDMKPT